MKKLLLLIPFALLLCGCNRNAALMPFLGKWSGHFEVTDLTNGGTAADIKRETLSGYVQVYATQRSYKMELQGEQETISITGFWTIKGNRITLNPKTVSIDDQGGAELRDPNKKFIPAADVHAAYGRPLVLAETTNNKALDGLKMSVGNLIGTHHFVKDSF